MSPEYLMGLAIGEAWKYQGLTYPNPAVGCAVAGSNNELLGLGAHRNAGGPHAEVLALKAAYTLLTGDDAIAPLDDAASLHEYLKTHHNGCFKACTLYVSLEPCAHEGKTPSCALLIKELGLKKVSIAHEDSHDKAAGGAAVLEAAGIRVETGLLRERAHELLEPFLRWQEERFVCFKWAQRLDGTVDGGTISSEASRIRVHAMRSVCDLLVIGGETVRTDRPTLDARMVQGAAPDVLIYSSHEAFDRSIPLFGVTGRKVFVENSLERMKVYKNILVEGGPGMLEAVKNEVDCYLCFVAPKSGGTIAFTKKRLEFQTLHMERLGDDAVMWLKEAKGK